MNMKIKSIYPKSKSELLEILFGQLQKVYGKHYLEEPPQTDLQRAAQDVEKAYSAAFVHIELT